MKNGSFLMFILMIVSCRSATAQVNTHSPQRIFEEKIVIIERFFTDAYTDGKKITEAAKFLEDVTGIKSDIDYGEPPLISPSKNNLKDWKAWYKKNKKLLYWDEKEEKVKVKE